MGEVPEVLVLGIVGFAADAQGDVVRLGVVDFVVAALEFPHAPGGDHRHLRRESLDGQFKAHLVVALAGAAVGDGVRALLEGDLGDALGDDGACERRAQQVLALVLRARLEGGEDVILDKFLAQVFDVELGSAGLDGLFLKALQLRALPHVRGHGDDFAALVVFLEPGDDDGRVQTAGIGQNDLLILLHRNALLNEYAFYGVYYTLICEKIKGLNA